MSAVVVDASLLVTALVEGGQNELLRRRLSHPRVMHAPHLLDYEFTNAIRGLVLGNRVDLAKAERVLGYFAKLRIVRYGATMTSNRAWELRNNFNPYDASYIALAERLDCPLLTTDVKLRGSHAAKVQIIPT